MIGLQRCVSIDKILAIFRGQASSSNLGMTTKSHFLGLLARTLVCYVSGIRILQFTQLLVSYKSELSVGNGALLDVRRI